MYFGNFSVNIVIFESTEENEKAEWFRYKTRFIKSSNIFYFNT